MLKRIKTFLCELNTINVIEQYRTFNQSVN
jgi:hypothetical protein